MTQLCPVQLKNMPGLHAVQVHTITHDHTRSHTCNHHGCKLLAYLEKLWHCDASVWCIACVSDVSHVFLMFYDVSGVSGVSVGLTPPKAGGSTVVSRCSVSGCAPGEGVASVLLHVLPYVDRDDGEAAALELWHSAKDVAAARGRLRRSQGSQGWELGKLWRMGERWAKVGWKAAEM